jgi:hypothetical protein
MNNLQNKLISDLIIYVILLLLGTYHIVNWIWINMGLENYVVREIFLPPPNILVHYWIFKISCLSSRILIVFYTFKL